MSKYKILLTIIFILMFSFFAGVIYQQYKDCEFNNGDFVKGVLFYKCVNKDK